MTRVNPETAVMIDAMVSDEGLLAMQNVASRDGYPFNKALEKGPRR